MSILFRKNTFFVYQVHGQWEYRSRCNLVFADVSVWMRYGAPYVRGLRTIRVNLYYCRTPLLPIAGLDIRHHICALPGPRPLGDQHIKVKPDYHAKVANMKFDAASWKQIVLNFRRNKAWHRSRSEKKRQHKHDFPLFFYCGRILLL